MNEGTVVTQEEENPNGVETEATQEGQQAGLEQEGVKDPNAGGEGGEAGEGAEQNEGEPTEEEVVEEQVDAVSQLQEKISELEKKLSAPVENKQQEYREPTEQQKQQLFEQTGFEYRGIQYINNQVALVGEALKGYVDNLYAQLTTGNAVKEFSTKKGFEDAGKYDPIIQKFLVDNVPAHQRSDPKAIETAYWYAKGKSTDKTMKNVINSREKNRHILKTTKITPAATATKQTRNTKVTLTPTQRSAARAVGWSDDQYMKEKGIR